jgi:hypothetical protein
VPSDDDDDLFEANLDPAMVQRQQEMLAGLSRQPSYYESYEETRVRFVLKFFLPKAASKLEHELRTNSGSELTFAGFNDMFPSFPVVLGAAKPERALHLDESCFLPNLFKEFAQSTLFKLMSRFFAEKIDTIAKRPAGLVVPRKGFPHGLVVHTLSCEHVGPVLTWPHGKANLYVQRFDNLLKSIQQSGWSP